MKTTLLLAMTLLGVLAIRADDSVSWTRHSWSMPTDIIVGEVLLSQTVYRDFPDTAPVMARYYRGGAQKGVVLVPSGNATLVIAGFAATDLLNTYAAELRRTPSISGVSSIAALIEERRQIVYTRREMSRDVGERIIAIWQGVAAKCAFRPFPVHNSVWSMQAEFSDGRVLAFDASGAAAERPVKQLIVITSALIDFASNRIDENAVMRVAVASQAELASMPSFPTGVDKRTYK